MTLSYELKQTSVLHTLLSTMLLHWEQKIGEEPLHSFSCRCFSPVRVEEGSVPFFGLSNASLLCLSRRNHCSQSFRSNPSPPLQQFLPKFSFSLILSNHSHWHINPCDIFLLKNPLSFLQTLTATLPLLWRRILRRLAYTCCISPSLTCLSRLLVIRKPALYPGLQRALSCQVHTGVFSSVLPSHLPNLYSFPGSWLAVPPLPISVS